MPVTNTYTKIDNIDYRIETILFKKLKVCIFKDNPTDKNTWEYNERPYIEWISR